MRILIGIMIGVFAVLILASLTNPMQELMQKTRGSDGFNCAGYVDATDASKSYNASLSGNTNTIGCSVSSFGVGFIVLATIIGIIMFILYGEQKEQMQQYNPYSAGY
jgi:amino acid permease